jgi:uncharacterized protein YaaQ
LPADTKTGLVQRIKSKQEVKMKLITAIINADDSSKVSAALTAGGFYSTKLSSSGGFLSSGNVTVLVCAENPKVDTAIEIIKKYSHKRSQLVPSAASFGVGEFNSPPIEVTVGGATIFVTDIERFEKV